MNKRSWLIIGLFCFTTGIFGYAILTAFNNPNVPADLRDAVADDNGAFPPAAGYSLGAASKVSALPVPKHMDTEHSDKTGKNNWTSLDELTGTSFLPREVEKKILNKIGVTCGDTWCESDYNYEFTRFECGTDKCRLEFFAYQHGPKQNLVQSAKYKYMGLRINNVRKGICMFPGVNSSYFSGILQDNFVQGDLFYETLDSCLSKIAGTKPAFE